MQANLVLLGCQGLCCLHFLFFRPLYQRHILNVMTPRWYPWRGNPCNNPSSIVSPSSSSSGAVGHIFSSSSGFSTNLQFSSEELEGRHPRQSPFITQSANDGGSVIMSYSNGYGALQSCVSSHCNNQNNESWCTV